MGSNILGLRLVIALGLAVLVLLGIVVATRDPGPPSAAELLGRRRDSFDTNDPVRRACALNEKILARIWRGHHPRSEDVTIVPRRPNFIGTTTVVSHSGPWDYLQRVPLVLYGPGSIRARGEVPTPATVADVYPTVGRLVDVDLPRRDGRVLNEALLDGGGRRPPKLIVTLVWDGGGWNMLDRWPDGWPTLARMIRGGTSFMNATVGSSPSITSAVHTTIGTGAFPRKHGIIGNDLRMPNGELVKSFAGRDPKDVELSTFGDDIDRALGNEPKVGLIGWKHWHLGMTSHGASAPDSDRDHMGLMYWDGKDVKLSMNATLFESPPHLLEVADIRRLSEQADREDGRDDDHWFRQHLYKKNFAVYGNPAWARYEAEVILSFWEKEGYGADDVPDLFFTNFKMTDLVGHKWTIDSDEVHGVLQAQDRALARMLRYLDEQVKDYVVILTADHGHTREPSQTGAWPIAQTEVISDIDAEFDVPKGQSLVQESAAVGLFLDRALKQRLDVSDDDVARFLNAYTIAENATTDELPEGYEDRGDEQVFSAAIPKDSMKDVMECAFGMPRAPEDLAA